MLHSHKYTIFLFFSMASHHLSFNPSVTPFSSPIINPSSLNFSSFRGQVGLTKCSSTELSPQSSSSTDAKPTGRKDRSKLEIGSPIIVTEAPQLLKTAASVPCLRANANLVKPGDVGRIVSRKPKDVWAIRLSIGTYLIDGKYFEPLELDG